MEYILLFSDTKQSEELARLLCRGKTGLCWIVGTKTAFDQSIPADSILVDGPPYCVDQIVARIRHFCQVKSCRVHRVIALHEKNVELLGSIHDSLGLRGISAQTAMLFRDKWLMKQRAQAAGIPVAAFARADDSEGVDRLVAGHQGRATSHDSCFVLKPRLDLASRGLIILHNQQELKAALHELQGQCGNLLIEDYVDGDEYHCDGLIVDSHVTHASAGKFCCSQARCGRSPRSFYFYHTLPPTSQVAQSLRQMHDRVVDAFGLREGLTHMEFYVRRSDSCLLLGEAAARPPAHGLMDAQRISYGKSLLNVYANLLRDEKLPSFQFSQVAGFVSFTAEAGTTRYFDDVTELRAPWIVDSYSHANKVLYVEEPSYLHEMGRVYVTSDDEIECEARLRTIASGFKYDVTPLAGK
jgi:hypothetical protein